MTTHNGRYVRLSPDSEGRADADSATAAAPFTLVRAGDTIALRTTAGMHLTMSGAGLIAAGAEPHPTLGRWTITAPPVVDGEPPPPGPADAAAAGLVLEENGRYLALALRPTAPEPSRAARRGLLKQRINNQRPAHKKKPAATPVTAGQLA